MTHLLGREIGVVIPLDIDGHIFDDKQSGLLIDDLRRRSIARFDGKRTGEAAFEREIEKVKQALQRGHLDQEFFFSPVNI